MRVLAYAAVLRVMGFAQVAASVVAPLAATHVGEAVPLPTGAAAIEVPNNALPVFHSFAAGANHPAEDVYFVNLIVVEAEEGHLYNRSSCHDLFQQVEALLVCTFPLAADHPVLESTLPLVLHMEVVVVAPAIPCNRRWVACVHQVVAVLHKAAAENEVDRHMEVLGDILEADHSCFQAFL